MLGAFLQLGQVTQHEPGPGPLVAMSKADPIARSEMIVRPSQTHRVPESRQGQR